MITEDVLYRILVDLYSFIFLDYGKSVYGIVDKTFSALVNALIISEIQTLRFSKHKIMTSNKDGIMQ